LSDHLLFERHIVADVDRQRFFGRNGMACLYSRHTQLGDVARTWQALSVLDDAATAET